MKRAAFPRSVRVGGKNKIKTETLRETCAALGFLRVAACINSGNVMFNAPESDGEKPAEKT